MKASLDYGSAQLAARHDGSEPVAKSGSTLQQSLAQIYESYFDFVWRNARRLGVPEASADDVTQDVFMIVQRRIDKYDGRASMQAWIFGILLRVVHDHRRSFRRKGARHVPLEQEIRLQTTGAVASSPMEQLERVQRVRLVDQLLSQLDEEKRALLILAELEEWTLREIAVLYGSNVNTIYSRLQAAKRDFERAYARSKFAKEPLP